MDPYAGSADIEKLCSLGAAIIGPTPYYSELQNCCNDDTAANKIDEGNNGSIYECDRPPGFVLKRSKNISLANEARILRYLHSKGLSSRGEICKEDDKKLVTGKWETGSPMHDLDPEDEVYTLTEFFDAQLPYQNLAKATIKLVQDLIRVGIYHLDLTVNNFFIVKKDEDNEYHIKIIDTDPTSIFFPYGFPPQTPEVTINNDLYAIYMIILWYASLDKDERYHYAAVYLEFIREYAMLISVDLDEFLTFEYLKKKIDSFAAYLSEIERAPDPKLYITYYYFYDKVDKFDYALKIDFIDALLSSYDMREAMEELNYSLGKLTANLRTETESLKGRILKKYNEKINRPLLKSEIIDYMRLCDDKINEVITDPANVFHGLMLKYGTASRTTIEDINKKKEKIISLIKAFPFGNENLMRLADALRLYHLIFEMTIMKAQPVEKNNHPYNFRERKKRKNNKLDAIDAINNNKVSLDKVNEKLMEMSRAQDRRLASLLQVKTEPGKGDGITAKVNLPQGKSIGIYFGSLRRKKNLKDKEYAQEIVDEDWVLDPKPWIENGYKPLPATLNTADEDRDNNVDVSEIVTIILRNVPSDEGDVDLQLEVYENKTNNKIKAGEFLNRSYGKDYVIAKKKITTMCDKTVIDMCDGEFNQNKLPCVPVKQVFFPETNSYGPSEGDPITNKSEFDKFCTGFAKIKDEIEVAGSGYILLKKSR